MGYRSDKPHRRPPTGRPRSVRAAHLCAPTMPGVTPSAKATTTGAAPVRGRARAESKYADVLAQRLINEIIEGDLRPGAMLPPEKEMLGRFGVGRASLREALRHLELQGVLSIRPGPGGG